jgi:hypothetical protein
MQIFWLKYFDSELLWVCSPTSTTQALRWPRTRVLTPEGIAVDTDTIPKFLEDATAEFSLWLIKDDRLKKKQQNKLIGIVVNKSERNEIKLTEDENQGLTDNRKYQIHWDRLGEILEEKLETDIEIIGGDDETNLVEENMHV